MLLDNIKELHINGSKVKEAWLGGNKVFSSGGWTLWKDSYKLSASQQQTQNVYTCSLPTSTYPNARFRVEIESTNNNTATLTLYVGSQYQYLDSNGTYNYVCEIDNTASPYTCSLTGDREKEFSSTSKITNLTFKITYTKSASIYCKIYVME